MAQPRRAQPAHAARPAESGQFWEVLRIPTPVPFSNVISRRLMGQPLGGAWALVPDESMVYHTSMHNPWIHLSTEAPYILACDRDALIRFNATASDAHAIHTEMYPEPFIGLPSAPVLFLGLNPGVPTGELQPPPPPILVKAYTDNLHHIITDIPFYLLNPAIGGDGYRWWTTKLRPLLQRYGEHFLARHIFAVEYFPYHSYRWSYRAPVVESQSYTHYLIQQAMERDAVIIIMRSYKLWTHMIPDLASYANMYQLNSPQNVIISPNNCPDGFTKIVRVLDTSMQENTLL